MNYKESANQIIDRQMGVDMHLDLGAIVWKMRENGQTKVIESQFLDGFRIGHIKLVLAAIFLSERDLNAPFKTAMQQIAAVRADVLESIEHFAIVESKSDLMDVLSSDKIGIIFSLEGAEPIERDIDLITIFKKVGVRLCGLTWSRRNYVADGSYFGKVEQGTLGGLTPFGINVVKKFEEKGIIIDLSHINDAGFSDVIKYATKPVIASHSNVRHINPITRNLTDQQIIEIAKTGGIIGINGYHTIVNANPLKQTVEGLVEHIDYIAQLVGVEHVAYGFDLCRLLSVPESEVDVIRDHGMIKDIIELLLSRGYSEEDCAKIHGGNAIEFFTKTFV